MVSRVVTQLYDTEPREAQFRAHARRRPSSPASAWGAPTRVRDQLLRKALSERHQQLEWASEPDLPPQQCPPPKLVALCPTRRERRIERRASHDEVGDDHRHR